MATVPTVRVPVEIIRPERTDTEKWSLGMARVALMAFSVWIVMLALGALTPWHLGYWETWLAIIAIRFAQAPDTTWLQWTKRVKN